MLLLSVGVAVLQQTHAINRSNSAISTLTSTETVYPVLDKAAGLTFWFGAMLIIYEEEEAVIFSAIVTFILSGFSMCAGYHLYTNHQRYFLYEENCWDCCAYL